MNRRIAQLIHEVMEKQEWFFSLQVEVVLPDTIFDRISISLEGRDWHPSGIADLWLRVDPERPEQKHQRHVHIAHQKHVKGAKGKQVAWNKDGTRHDQMHFNEALGSRKDVQQVARAALGLPTNFGLEDASGIEVRAPDFQVHERGQGNYLLVWNG